MTTRLCAGMRPKHLPAPLSTPGGEVASDAYIESLRTALSGSLESAMKAQLLALPSEALLADRAAQSGLVDVHAIHTARESLMSMLGDALSAQLCEIVDKALQNPVPYQPNATQAGERMLVHAALAFLMAADGGRLDSAQQMYAQASNLSDRLCAARLIINHGDEAHRAHRGLFRKVEARKPCGQSVVYFAGDASWSGHG